MNHNHNQNEQESYFECLVCQREFAESELEDHATHCFGYHADMGEDVLLLKFEQV